MSSVWILNFHGLGVPPEHVDARESPYWISTQVFEEVLQRLTPSDPVVLTFDDGNRSDLELALPILAKHRRQATFFLCAGRLGNSRYLSAIDARELLAAGMSIGSHGWAHSSWRKLPSSDRTQEWSAARKTLQDATGASIKSAACPFGEYDRAALAGLRAAGFERVYTSDGAPTRSDSCLLARRTVTNACRPKELIDALHRAPSPFASVCQRLRQTIKGLR